MTALGLGPIDAEIALALTALDEARADALAAAGRLARDPSNPKVVAAVLEAKSGVASALALVEVLQGAREAAEAFAQSEAGIAQAEDRKRAVATVGTTQAAIVKSAAGVDKALGTLLAAMRTYREARCSADAAVVDFLDRTPAPDIEARLKSHEMLSRVPGAVPHAVALQVHQALEASGLDMQGLVSFNPFMLTPGTGAGGAHVRTMRVAAEALAADVARKLADIEAGPKPAVALLESGGGLAAGMTDMLVARSWDDLMRLVAKTLEAGEQLQAEGTVVAEGWPDYLAAAAGLPAVH